MKRNTSLYLSLGLMILAASLYRVMPDRQPGFAPQLAMAVFAGAIMRDKRLAFALPLISMLVSDALYQVLFNMGLTKISGFYSGQWINYLLFTSMTVFGLMIRRGLSALKIGAASLAAPSAYFLLSNFQVWASHGGFGRPMTAEGLMMCYADGIPFYQNSIVATLVFSAVLFGSYFLVARRSANLAGR